MQQLTVDVDKARTIVALRYKVVIPELVIKGLAGHLDLIIEIVDARIPYSSSNPVIEQFRGKKPWIRLLNKSDLADPDVTALWQAHWEKQQGVKAIAVTSQRPEQIRGLIGLIKNILKGKENALGNVTVLITGIPNVGKSTIINILAGKQIAKTGNEPAITKGQQCINLNNGMLLYDTPGILWPKIENVPSGYRLAATGAIKETAMSADDVAVFAVGFLMKAYPEQMKERFKLDVLPEGRSGFSGNDRSPARLSGQRRPCRFPQDFQHPAAGTAEHRYRPRHDGNAGDD
jgi:ribosome biogenesis GTPase A